MKSDVTAIVGGQALLGESLSPVEDAVVVMREGRLEAAGPGPDVAIPPEAATFDASGWTLIPGFIDAHVHIGFYDPRDVLAGGVTTVRDLGWPPDVIFDLVQRSEGDFTMPRVLATGPMLTAPGGYPTSAGWAPPGTGREIASEDEARRAVDELVERGTAAIKVALHPDVGPTLAPVVLRAIVEHAHSHDLKVTGHVAGLAELDKAIAAGVDELAHMLMSAETIPAATIERMVEVGMAIVPTLSIRQGADRDVALANVAAFLHAGGRVIYGTDLGNEGPRPGIDPREIAAMTAAGMDGRAIVTAATVDAAAWLELDDVGFIARGMQADLVAVRGDPLANPEALTNVAMVWRAGHRAL